MEIAAMISELKLNAAQTEKEIPPLEKLVADLSSQLRTAEATLRIHKDSLDALKLAIESLEVVLPQEDFSDTPPVKQNSAKKAKLNRTPKQIIKLNASGKQIGSYRSISQCAKALGWSFPGTKKYIENINPEKQIRLKGFVLKYAD